MGLLNWMLNADSDEILQLDWSPPCWDGSSNSLSLPLSILQLLCANSFSHRFRSLFFKMETVELPPAKDLDINVLTLCAIFRTKYLDQCKESILSDKR